PLSFELREWCVVVEGWREARSAVHVVSFDFDEPVRIDVEPQSPGDVVLLCRDSRAIVNVWEEQRVIDAGRKPFRHAVGRHRIGPLAHDRGCRYDAGL